MFYANSVIAHILQNYVLSCFIRACAAHAVMHTRHWRSPTHQLSRCAPHHQITHEQSRLHARNSAALARLCRTRALAHRSCPLWPTTPTRTAPAPPAPPLVTDPFSRITPRSTALYHASAPTYAPNYTRYSLSYASQRTTLATYHLFRHHSLSTRNALSLLFTHTAGTTFNSTISNPSTHELQPASRTDLAFSRTHADTVARTRRGGAIIAPRNETSRHTKFPLLLCLLLLLHGMIFSALLHTLLAYQ